MATTSINPSADATFDEQDPGQNYNDPLIKWQQRDFDSILKFPLSGLPEFSIISAATLYFYCSQQLGSTVGRVCETTDGWTETGVNWGNAPPKGTLKGNLTTGTGWKSVNVTSYVQAQWAGDKVVSFRIGPTAGALWDGQACHSRENTNKPYLYITYTVLTPPTAPSNCVSHYVATNNAKCTWNDNSDNETGFRIEKAIDGAGFSFWKNVGAGVTDSGTYTLGANHRIKFQVRAYNAAGSSAYSTSGYAYTTPAAPSGAVTHYVATNKAHLHWADNSAYESGFRVEYAAGAAGWVFWYNAGVGVIVSADGSFGANTRVKIRVRAYIGALVSTFSEGSYVYTVPTTPSGIALSWLSQDETVRVTWTDNSAYEQDFDIEKAVDGGGYGHLVYDVASPYDDTAPSGVNHRYIYRVRARCPDGRLSGWNTASAYIHSTPAAPTNCAIALGTINVTWTDNSAYEDAFQVERQLDEGGWVLIHTTAAEAESWGDSSQPTDANIKYEYRVRAKIGTLYSTYSTSNVMFAKTFYETIGLTDTHSKVWSIYRTFTETITLSDTYSRVCNWFKTFIETITLTDTLQKKPAKTFIEKIALSDSLTKRVYKTFIESITLSDTYSRVWKIYRTFTETISLSDTYSRVCNWFKSFTETLHLQDRYTRVVSWHKVFTEKITLTDTVKKVKSNLIQLWKKLINLFDIEG